MVRAWKTGLDAITKALTLSHHNNGGVERNMPKSRRSIRSQNNSAAVEANALYSASVEDLETVDYFLADQVIGQLPKKTTIPKIDLGSTGSLAQSASQKADKEEKPGVKAKP